MKTQRLSPRVSEWIGSSLQPKSAPTQSWVCHIAGTDCKLIHCNWVDNYTQRYILVDVVL